MAKAGFTGTRTQLSAFQRANLMTFLAENKPEQFHYGDCTGADYEGFVLATALRLYTVSHPPSVPKYRMFTTANEERPKKPYLVRNLDIVKETDYLIACPREDREPLSRVGSGTWTTVEYARHWSRPLVLLWPDGRVDIAPDVPVDCVS